MGEQSTMQGPPAFDPFEDRLCRDLRNDLSEGLMAMLSLGKSGGLDAVLARYRQGGVPPFASDYLNDRLARYRTVLGQIEASGTQADDTYAIARLLWNEELFFEVHEWLEAAWMKATGTDRLILQALIRAAGTYVHLRHGRPAGARKMADKAVTTLLRYKSLVPQAFPVEELVARLATLDPLPPKFK